MSKAFKLSQPSNTLNKLIYSTVMAALVAIGGQQPKPSNAASPLRSIHQEECMTIAQKYQALGGPAGFLGPPVTKELSANGRGLYQHYRRGTIHWSPETCAHETHGAIRERWEKLSWHQGLTNFPITDELTTPDGVGRFNHFQSASIYWHPATGAHEIYGFIRDRWAQTGWELGPLGYPTTGELAAGSGPGRYSQFQNGTIYWHPDTGTSVVMNERWTQISNTPLEPRTNSRLVDGSGVAILGGSSPVLGGAGSGSAFRRVKVFGSMYINDEEWFASNETGTFEISGSEVIPEKAGGAKLFFAPCVGDEVRVEMDVFAATVEENDSINVQIHIRLFEGTTCGTQDLEKRWDEQLTVPAGESEVFSKFFVGDGDYVEISNLTISNVDP